MDYVDPFADPELPDRYFLLVEQQQDSAAMDVSVDAEATGNQSRLTSAASAQQKSALVQIEGYVKGLLTSHGTMSLERLHSMLKMITSSSSGSDAQFDMSLQQLRAYLQGLVDIGKIEYLEGVYAMCQPGNINAPTGQS
uniref:Anaphase-promoting complex subunit 2 C-terminal domain-containing protein n=1 Tax=Spumella elongata TaxID=89044 RepID=A0A7S3MFL3_9STRA|mmetsp:Transcript_58342/g.102601  ORF Transcript_58342/g.102601 Transcript_58342/m.102601 type:complete len:139 (+) Transcript_58342:1-417(+)